ncbi:hypothetical protein ABIA26_004610 [Sinorhizobium fredii]
MIMDMSDKAMAERFGDILFEIPELWNALRVFEMQNRPVKGGFKVRGGAGVSVNCGSIAGRELRIWIGHR